MFQFTTTAAFIVFPTLHAFSTIKDYNVFAFIMKKSFVFLHVLSAAHVQACRALMIISLLLGLGCLIVSLLGLKCIKIGSTAEESKAKIAATGGLLSIIGGTWTKENRELRVSNRDAAISY